MFIFSGKGKGKKGKAAEKPAKEVRDDSPDARNGDSGNDDYPEGGGDQDYTYDSAVMLCIFR